MSRSAAVLALTVALLALIGCPETTQVPPATPPQPPAKVSFRVSKSGLGFRLGDADGRDDRPPPPAKITPLGEAEANKVIARLPPVGQQTDDEKGFALRDRSKPPPRTGKTIHDAFPPPANAGPPPATTNGASAPLTVSRKAPVGDVPLAPALSVTFSAPMVPVGSIVDLAQHPPPVVLTPTPKGKWRWAGTQTAVFDPDKRFPMATEYKVEVPAGTRGANGNTLAGSETWTFSTPPPHAVHLLPAGKSVGLDPVLYADFDQAIDAQALLGAMVLSSDGGAVPLRLATDDEVETDTTVRRLREQAQPGRWIALKATSPLVPGTGYTLSLPAGTPSAEGPRRTTAEQHATFRTYDPLRWTLLDCSAHACPPGAPWSLGFNNRIDEEKFDRKLIKVSPEPESMKIAASGYSIEIFPRSHGKTRYTITVSGALADVFGQTLGKDDSRTVAVGSAEPYLFPEEGVMSVLDPEGSPSLPLFTINRPSIDVKLYAVGPDDWPAYLKWREAWDGERKRTTPPGKLIASRAVKPAKHDDDLVVTPLDLSPALQQGLGQVLVIAEPPGPPPKDPWNRQMLHTWVQVTRIGLDAFYDSDSLTAWTTRLSDGAPLSGVDVSVTPGGGSGASGADGLARLALTSTGSLVIARKGADLAILPESFSRGNVFVRRNAPDTIRWLVFDDRGLYKPGEEIHVKGWLRRVGMGKGGDVGAVPNVSGRAIRWSIKDAMHVEIGKGTSTADATGGFDLTHKLPGTPNLGQATLSLEIDAIGDLQGTSTLHTFQLEEFRRPEFEVSAHASDGPFLVGGHAEVTVSATYYAGGGLPNAEAKWSVSRDDAHFTPPNRSEYTFGKAFDSWWIDRRSHKYQPPETWDGRTGAAGEHRLRVDFDAVEPPYPMHLGLDATVTDVNRQAWSAHSDLLVHPASVYVGVKQERTFVQAGEPLGVEVIVTDLDGAAVAGRPVTLKSARIDWAMKKGEYVEVEADPDTCTLTSAAEPQRCSLRTKQGGRYKVTAVVTDDQGRKNQTETHLWVLGGDDPGSNALQAGQVQVIPAKPSYKAGETADLLLVAPFAPAEGVLVVERQGMVRVQRFRLEARTGTLRLPIEAAWIPNVHLRVALAGAAPRENARGEPDPSLPKKPAYAMGDADILVPATDRKLDISVKPREAKLDPGGSTTVDLDVRDASGQPVAGSSAALVIVDEAVLALAAYRTPDPMVLFYSHRWYDTRDMALRSHVLIARTDDKVAAAARADRDHDGIADEIDKLDMKMLGGRAAPAASAAPAPGAKQKSAERSFEFTIGNALEGEAASPIKVRSDLRALALFSPAVTTDARGHAAVEVKLPDNLTRYRVMAVAVAGDQKVGSAESSITARLPLMVRPSAPRFLNYGDRFDLPVVVQNQTDKPLEVDVAARAFNASLTGSPGVRVTVPANDRVEVRLPAAAAKPGKARFQIGAASGRLADAAFVELPVWTPATSEAFATYGTIDEGAIAQPVQMPSAVATDFGGVEISTTSTAVSALTDAVLYLVRYPFECNEQISSRLMAIAALRDVLSAFSAKDLPSQQEMIASMARDIEKLQARQHYSGGWSFWTSDFEPWPYLSVHVAHALSRARDKGYAVPKPMLDKALGYLKNIEAHIPHTYSKESRYAIVAYSLYVRKRLGDPDPARARSLIAKAGGVERMQIDMLGWLWPTLSEEAKPGPELEGIRRLVANRVTETAGAAHFATSYEDGAYVLLASSLRADGILLEAMIGDQPKSDLIPKLVTGLLAHRKAGRWSSTQENAFVLLALDRYFATYEKATPDFVARAWLGDRYAGEHAFKGRSSDRHEIDIPMRALAEVGGGNVVVQKDGAGRLYYRIGMTYAPSNLRPPPAEHGFSVSRVYESVDDPADVKRDADGTWRVKAGAKVRVRVTMVAPARRYHVALVDPLPAGLEVMNPALATTGPVPADAKADTDGLPWWWSRAWYEHQNLRDERVEAFTSLLWDGVYDYTYVARATTPGTFVVPPPKAEEMYSPETFGRGAGDRLIVE